MICLAYDKFHQESLLHVDDILQNPYLYHDQVNQYLEIYIQNIFVEWV